MFLASIPFNVVKLIGNHVLDLTIYPFNEVLKFAWGLFVSVLFIACCFAIFITMFKQYFKGEKRVEKGNYIYFYIIERKENYGKKICFWRAI